MMLLERGIALNDWQQGLFNYNFSAIPAYHRLGRRIGKTFLSYVIAIESALKDSDSLVLIDPMIDPDNTTKRLKDNWALELHLFASKYYPEVAVSSIRYKSTIVIETFKKPKKLRLLNAIKDFL